MKSQFNLLIYLGMKLDLHISEEHILRVLENRLMRIIFKPKKEEVPGGWRILHNREDYTKINLWWH